MPTYILSDFDFQLPKHLIAQQALPQRTASRLMIVESNQKEESPLQHHQPTKTSTPKKCQNNVSTKLSDKNFFDLPKYLQAGDLMVYNNTLVLKARLYGKKNSGGKAEILIEKILSQYTALAQIRTSKSKKIGTVIWISDTITVCIEEIIDQFYKIRFNYPCTYTLNQYGHVPLPPYIHHHANNNDTTRYQTIYACRPGSIAAPTAGLHFDHALLSMIQANGVQICPLTLHIGAGTFSPIRVTNLQQHKMHSESYTIPQETINAIKTAKKNGKKIIAVGTTTLRALESAAIHGHFNYNYTQTTHWHETNLFITPGFDFQIVDKLVTNFHLPKSSLLLLVSAFSGYQTIKDAYEHAIKEHYRFFSYGDAMLLSRNT